MDNVVTMVMKKRKYAHLAVLATSPKTEQDDQRYVQALAEACSMSDPLKNLVLDVLKKRRRGGWRPIEQVDRGAVVDVWAGGHRYPDAVFHPELGWMSLDGIPICAPTHFMLPPPPPL